MSCRLSWCDGDHHGDVVGDGQFAEARDHGADCRVVVLVGVVQFGERIHHEDGRLALIDQRLQSVHRIGEPHLPIVAADQKCADAGGACTDNLPGDVCRLGIELAQRGGETPTLLDLIVFYVVNDDGAAWTGLNRPYGTPSAHAHAQASTVLDFIADGGPHNRVTAPRSAKPGATHGRRGRSASVHASSSTHKVGAASLVASAARRTASSATCRCIEGRRHRCAPAANALASVALHLHAIEPCHAARMRQCLGDLGRQKLSALNEPRHAPRRRIQRGIALALRCRCHLLNCPPAAPPRRRGVRIPTTGVAQP